jgi:hypothetical protein
MMLWRIRPMREPLKRRKLETRLRNSSERCLLRAEPRLPCPRFVPHHAFLCDAANVGSRNSEEGSRDLRYVTRKNTERCVFPRVRFRIIGETES